MNQILYIAGYPRSGSTLLGNLLAENPQCFAIGEPVFLWHKNINNGYCSCLLPLEECAFWAPILNSTPKTCQQPIDNTFDNSIGLKIKNKLTPLLKTQVKLETTLCLQYLYDSLFKKNPNQIIIDESKFSHYLYALLQLKNIEVNVIHLIRNPQAVAYSWTRKKYAAHSDQLMNQYHPLATARRWLLENIFIEKVCSQIKYLPVRYEDFVANPAETIQNIQQWVGLNETNPFIHNQQAEIKKQPHLIASNPIGTRKGIIHIQPDDEWKLKLPIHWQFAIKLICWPLIKKYHYE